MLLVFPANKQRIVRWMLWALVTVSKDMILKRLYSSRIYRQLFGSFRQGLFGGILCDFKINDGPIPINKNLWSLSYVLVTSSIAFFLLTILYVFIDVLSWWSGAPFRYAGIFHKYA